MGKGGKPMVKKSYKSSHRILDKSVRQKRGQTIFEVNMNSKGPSNQSSARKMFDYLRNQVETPKIDQTSENTNVMGSGIASTLSPDYHIKSENTLIKNQTIKSG